MGDAITFLQMPVPAGNAVLLLERISKMVSDKNDNASQVNESEVVLKKSIVAN